ncbi:MAG: hypothetical protein AVDCRST_MAG59-3238 [uncultured Thermomicrobiales bacterium]|uniref:Excalibur calcium-binding domain-containing protein n=1 Tax=uncultured Thermomicrobiales bacterium TaxID=1645740 RepID=A0A6J4V9S8_9BACT|nr:MAG: hypothetical protein AVDCRST_MAG59-3238 [uncultured Thermomicrobiales bacterium]
MKRSLAMAFAAVVGLGVAVAPVAAQDQLVITADGASGNVAGSGSRENQDGGTIIFGDITSDGETTIITAAVPAAPAPPPAPEPAPAPAAEPAPAPSEGAPPAAESDRAVPTATDADADNYPDASEAGAGLDAANPDTDADGLADGDEINIYSTDPTIFDTDGDGLGDGEEEFATGTDPTDPSDGNAVASEQAVASSEPTARTPSSTAPASAGCADYADWYAAQNAYEAAGGTAASGAIVESLDPDRDGIACESMMEA